jgi:fructokinase
MNKKSVCFGEVLWDNLPGVRVAGGAPLNAAIRMQSLGIPSSILSSVGNDPAGDELFGILEDRQVNTELLQKNDHFPTGEVHVKINEEGLPAYDIVFPSAWDEIRPTPEGIRAVSESDVFIFGSLACRNTVSRETLSECLNHADFSVFDVNLRPPFYEIPLIESLLKRADVIKMNDEELLTICSALGSGSEYIEENVRFLSAVSGSGQICITRGKEGAILFTDHTFTYCKGFPVVVKDTVGSGDSFLAALVVQLLKKSCAAYALQFACAVGAMVATHTGANPTLSLAEIHSFLQENQKPLII